MAKFETNIDPNLHPSIHPALRTVGLTFLLYALGLVALLGFAEYLNISLAVDAPQFEFIWRVWVLIGAMVVGYVYLHYLTTTLSISTDQLTKKSGVLTRNFARVEIDKITNYNYHRSSLELLFGLVDLEIESSGATVVTPGIVMRFLSMADAKAIMAGIREQKEAINNRMGLRKIQVNG